MEKIDWSKAPEGATHYMKRHYDCAPCWVKVIPPNAYYSYGGDWDTWHSWQDYEQSLIPRPSQPWNGTGLPPVGTVCEIAASSDYVKISYPAGAEVKIYAHFTHENGTELAAFASADGKVYGVGFHKIFRPIRTPEQIAAEEREKAIQQCAKELHAARGELTDISHSLIVAAWLFDNGYRKQPTNQPQEDK